MLRLGLAVVLALAVLGAVLSVAAWRAAAAPAAPAVPVATGSGPFAVGQEIRTSWGYLDVTHVDPVAGISAHDIGHAAAGVSVRDFVKEGQQELQVTLDLTSAQRARTVGYAPAQFRLRVGTSKTTVEPSLATLLSSQLQPLAVVEGHVGFVVPAGAQHLRLEYADPGRARPVVVDLGAVAATSLSQPQGHLHH